MRTFRLLTLIYGVNLVSYLFVNSLFYNRAFYLVEYVGFWVAPLIFVLLGQGIGKLIAYALEKPDKNFRIYKTCAIIASISFISILFYKEYSNWDHEEKFGNIEQNEDYFKYWVEGYKLEKRMAFDTLIKKYSDPNSIKILDISVKDKDTMIENINETIYLLHIIYNKKYLTQKYTADLEVIKNNAYLNFFDKPMDAIEQFKIDSTRAESDNKLQKELKVLPDSIRNLIKKEFKELNDE